MFPQPLGRGHVRLSKSIYNFTERQDVRLAVGYRGTMDDKGNVKGVRLPQALLVSRSYSVVSATNARSNLQSCTSGWPLHVVLRALQLSVGISCRVLLLLLQDYYGQLRENNWALHTDFK